MSIKKPDMLIFIGNMQHIYFSNDWIEIFFWFLVKSPNNIYHQNKTILCDYLGVELVLTGRLLGNRKSQK